MSVSESSALQIARDLARRPAPPLPALKQEIPGPRTCAPRTLADVEPVFSRWLHLPDPGPLYVVLGTVAANLMVGDPTWLLLIGPPGGGKTEIVQSVGLLPHVHVAATLTEAGLLSGTPRKEKAADSTGGLLRAIGEFGILVCKEFTSVLNMARDARGTVLAALREIYDGSWTRHLGTDGGRTLSWPGKLGLVAGCTQAIDSHHAVIAAMGERFVFHRLSPIDERKQATTALTHAGREKEMRAELSGAVAGLFERLGIPEQRPTMGDAETLALVDLATLAVRCRSAVERDPVRRDIDLIPDPEAPGRLTLALARLLGGLLVIGVEHDEAWRIVQKSALDCMPAPRRGVFDLLVSRQTEMDTTEIATTLGYPTTTARRSLEDLNAHGVIGRNKTGKGSSDLWNLSEWAAERYLQAVALPFPKRRMRNLPL